MPIHPMVAALNAAEADARLVGVSAALKCLSRHGVVDNETCQGIVSEAVGDDAAMIAKAMGVVQWITSIR